MLADLLYILIGGFLVTLGVMASAVSDRIRGLRANKPVTVAAPAPTVVETVEVLPLRPKRSPVQVQQNQDADEVIAALMGAGYKKQVASVAVWSCSAADRASIEAWVKAALQRCAQGGVS